MSTTTSKPDWIYPGAEVVVWRDTFGMDRPDCRITTVQKVAAKSFTVEQVSERFQMDSLATKKQGSSWTGWRWRVVPVGSDKHRELEAADRKYNAKANARRAADEWQVNRDDPAHIAAVIEAFTALRGELA